MEELVMKFNLAASALIAIGIGWAVMSHRVKDGVIIKAGLILMAFGFASTVPALYGGLENSDLVALSRSAALIHIGLIIVVIGYLLRTRAGAKKQRRRTDWMDIDGVPSAFDRRVR